MPLGLVGSGSSSSSDSSGASLGADAATTNTGASDIMSAANAQVQSILQKSSLAAGQNPLSFGATAQQPSPQPKFQPPEATYPNRAGGYGTTGERKRDEKASLFHTLAGLVKSGGEYIQQKKERALQIDITTILNAAQGRQQAESVLKDPNSSPEQKKEAQKALVQNSDIMNNILSDPKKQKQFAKAFNFSFMGDNKNPNETKALMKAYSEFKPNTGQLSPPAQKFMQQQPVNAQENPIFSIMAKAVKDDLIPGAKATAELYQKTFDTLSKAQTATEKIAASKDMFKMLIGVKDRAIQASINNTLSRNLTAVANAKVHYDYEIYKADKVYQLGEDRVKVLKELAGKNSDNKYIANLFRQAQVVQSQYKNNLGEMKVVQGELDKYAADSGFFRMFSSKDKKSDLTPEQAKDLRNRIITLKVQQSTLEQQMNTIKNSMDTINKLGTTIGIEQPDASPTNPIEVSPADMNDSSSLDTSGLEKSFSDFNLSGNEGASSGAQ